ncbi:VWA domain-containing protein [Actinomadura sp. NAK00032]|uniref:substrate-binding and VWA domain-containing protein n=1 Tax=Actinomadura sp. NAK00032 TaxID=2742128 RepID=UPI0015917DA6|nr:substrate-binding and VWA domain-containing protein [Actinomadura sp. NAK00032]QKW36509.1 VWA domain-containing protein [Actinomadura sp. NAK00032]
MSGHDDVPEWAPRSSAEPGGIPYVFLGVSEPSGPPVVRAERARAAGPAHAAVKPRRRREAGPRRVGGVLLGPLAGAVGLVLLTGAAAYAFGTGGGCSGGEVAVSVAVAPDVAPAVVRAAGRFNDARHEVDGRCVSARVRATDPAAVATLLSGKGVAGVSERPDVWIPDSSLWIGLAGGRSSVLGSVATTPIVVAMPRGLALQLRNLGAPARPSWTELLAAAGTAEGAAGDSVIPPRLLRLQVPDPGRSATGMGTLVLANTLLKRSPAGFTGVVRTIREGVAVSVKAEFDAFRTGAADRYPVALAPEQAVRAYNSRRPAAPVVAVHPAEGTVYLDHPVAVLAPGKARAARLLWRELSGAAVRDDVRRLGFRAPGGAASPEALPAVPAAEVRRIMQSWAQLSLSIRMLSIIDVSGSMDERVAPGVTRLQSTVRTAQGGLSLLPEDSELGQWIFSTELEGGRDWRELVSVGPLDERLGSATRRQLVLSAFARIRVKPHGDTGLYETVMAAFDYMKRTYKPEYVNSVLLWTDGRNEDPGGPSLEETLDHMRREYDPERPVQVNMLGYGRGVDVDELRRIARVTHGDAYVAETPGQIQGIFLKAVSRRVCEPDC